MKRKTNNSDILRCPFLHAQGSLKQGLLALAAVGWLASPCSRNARRLWRGSGCLAGQQGCLNPENSMRSRDAFYPYKRGTTGADHYQRGGVICCWGQGRRCIAKSGASTSGARDLATPIWCVGFGQGLFWNQRVWCVGFGQGLFWNQRGAATFPQYGILWYNVFPPLGHISNVGSILVVPQTLPSVPTTSTSPVVTRIEVT